jgi:prevent-host-death family protein
MSIKIVPISDLRRRPRDVIDAAQNQDDAVYITRHGRPVVVVIGYERYEQMLAQLQDLTDQLHLKAAADESARPYIDFAQEMGLPAELHQG